MTDEKRRYVIIRRAELTDRLAAEINAWKDTQVIAEEEYENRRTKPMTDEQTGSQGQEEPAEEEKPLDPQELTQDAEKAAEHNIPPTNAADDRRRFGV